MGLRLVRVIKCCSRDHNLTEGVTLSARGSTEVAYYVASDTKQIELVILPRNQGAGPSDAAEERG